MIFHFISPPNSHQSELSFSLFGQPSIAQQFQQAGRDELAAQEILEIKFIQEFLPAQLSDAELTEMVDAAIAGCDASGMQAMGAVMGQLKPKLQGRADIGAVSQMVKSRLVS